LTEKRGAACNGTPHAWKRKKNGERERELAHGPRAAVDCSIDKRARPEKENIFFEISFYSTESNLF
jgi:hypothetical protein